MTLRLPNRPRGVRKSWKKTVPNMAELGKRLCGFSYAVSPMLGHPVEGAEFRCRGQLRRIEALYANGKHISVSFLKGGRCILRLSRIGGVT